MDHSSENERYNQYMKRLKQVNINDFAPPYNIQHTESPFLWIQQLKTDNLTFSDCQAKIDDCANQGDSYTLELFIPYLALAFEYAVLNNFQEAKSYLNKVEDTLCTMRSNNDYIYSRISHALEHIFLATKTNIFILENGESEGVYSLKEECSKLKPLAELDAVQQAAIHALKSMFYLSCSTETELALTLMKEAVRLDPQCATWKYWTGIIIMCKTKGYNNEHDPSEELSYFEEAAQLDRNANHLVFLAQAYRKRSRYLSHNKNNLETPKDDIYNEMDALNQQSYDLYMESLELSPESATICRRAGNGLMNLPKQYAKCSLAKHLLHKAEELSKNPATYHILGTYYSRYEQNLDKAVEYFQKSADNNRAYGYNEVIRIKYVNDPDYDPLEDLLKAAKGLEISRDLPYIEADIGWYYTINKNNVFKGLEYFWKIIERDQYITWMKTFYCYAFVIKGPLNMYKVLYEKVLNVEEEFRNELMIKFLDKVNSNPQLLEDCFDCVSLEEAQSESMKAINWEQNRRKRYEDKLNQGNQFRSGFFNRRNGSGSSSETRASQERSVTSADRAPPKQENWRQECRKF